LRLKTAAIQLQFLPKMITSNSL